MKQLPTYRKLGSSGNIDDNQLINSTSGLPSSPISVPKDKFIVLSKTDQFEEKFTNSMRKRSISTSETEYMEIDTQLANDEISSLNTINEVSAASQKTVTKSMTITDPINLSLSTKFSMKPLIINESCPKPIQECSTLECKKSAQRILALMDHSIDPCDDFYKYACGGMTRKNDNDVDLLLPGKCFFLFSRSKINADFD